MSQLPHIPSLCGFISNAKPLNENGDCQNRGIIAFNYRGGKLYLCDRHASHLGVLIARKEEELRNCPYDFKTVAHMLIQQLQHMIEIWTLRLCEKGVTNCDPLC